jgi:uncharacterized protein YjbI with pentapeptide repeats
MNKLKNVSLIACVFLLALFVFSNRIINIASAVGQSLTCTTCLFESSNNLVKALKDEDTNSTVLSNSQFVDVDFSGLSFTDTQMDASSLENVDFSDADLNSSDMSYSTFHTTASTFENANLYAVHMDHVAFDVFVDLDGVNLEYATLLGATNMGTNTSRTGITWGTTICPDGTNSDNNSNTCEGHLTP